MFDLASREIELPLPILIIGAVGTRDQHLTDNRHRRPGRRAEDVRTHGHVAPAKHGEAVRRKHFLDERHGRRGQRRFDRQEALSDRNRRIGADVDTKSRGRKDEEPSRNLRQEAGAVRAAIRRRRAAMGESRGGLKCELHYFVGALAALARNEPHAAGVTRCVGRSGVRVVERAALIRA